MIVNSSLKCLTILKKYRIVKLKVIPKRKPNIQVYRYNKDDKNYLSRFI